MREKKFDWVITVGGGYGSYTFHGTEAEAERERCRKATWEQAVARKKLAETQPNSATTAPAPGQEGGGNV